MNSKLSKVSVITITRNRAKLLKRAISSVVKQSYANLEYIIIDGASDDNTEEVVTSYTDARIKYFKQTYNKDPRISMDDAVKLASGKYITFLDDDDEYLPFKIEKQVNAFEKLPLNYGLVYCWMDYIDEQKQKTIYKYRPKLSGDLFEYLLEKQVIGGTPTLLMKKEIYHSVGGWNKDIDYYSDWELLIRISKITKIGCVTESLVNVYINHGYLRQSKLQNRLNENKLKIVNFHKYLLKEYKDEFCKYKSAKVHHYLSIAFQLSTIKEYKEAGSFLLSAFRIKPFSLQIYKYIVKMLFGYDNKKIA